MSAFTMRSHAKVNLSLDVLERRAEDGYHYIRTVMVPISLADTLLLASSSDLVVTSEGPIPGPMERNLAWRAAQLLKQSTGYRGGASIHIRKSIPIAGGLAGGSTNAAAVLTGLNRMWNTGLSLAELEHLAIRLGSDVPFFIGGRPARVEGIGERVTPIPLRRPLWMVLVVPSVVKSTANVYRLYDELAEVSRPDTTRMERALASGELPEIASSLGNVFEQVMLPRHPEILALKEAAMVGGAVGVLMSGAGPTVLGLAEDEGHAQRLLAQLAPLATQAFLVHTVSEVEEQL